VRSQQLGLRQQLQHSFFYLTEGRGSDRWANDKHAIPPGDNFRQVAPNCLTQTPLRPVADDGVANLAAGGDCKTAIISVVCPHHQGSKRMTPAQTIATNLADIDGSS